MAHAEMIEFHSDIHPHSYGISILLLIALIAILFLFIGAFSQSRRNAGQRAGQKAPPNGGPRSGPVGVCQRCRNALSVEAEYCARCGLPVTRPTPLPMPPQRTQPSHSRWLIYAAIALLGLVGFGAFWFMSESEPMPAPPTQQHAPSDAW